MFQVYRFRFSRAIQLDVNPLHYGFDIGVDVRILKSNDTIPFMLEPRLANTIPYGCLVLVVMSAIEFNDEARSRAEKIHHIRSNWRLTSEVCTRHGKLF
jgi:hypothetical protein